jgi:4-hydroxyphenylpyruvate dioxygenase
MKSDPPQNPCTLRGLAHIEIYTHNLMDSFERFRDHFTLLPLAQEQSVGKRSLLIGQGEVRLKLSEPLGTADAHICNFLDLHGEGVSDVAFHVDSFDTAMGHARKCGSKTFEQGVKTFGDLRHSFIEGKPDNEPAQPLASGHFSCVDHLVGNLHRGDLPKWERFYQDVLGFEPLLRFVSGDVGTKSTGLISTVMRAPGGFLKIPLNEPEVRGHGGQIQEFLDANEGPGVQHIALETADILTCVQDLRKRGLQFLASPEAYYQGVETRFGGSKWPLALKDLKALEILVDHPGEGWLYQIFTRSLNARKSFFVEIIQRDTCDGFGQGNFQALFESLEGA